MNKKNLLKIINVLLALVFISTATGGLIRFFIPSVIPYEAFRLFHPISGMSLVLLVLIHINLNFGWIKSTYLKKK